MCCTSKVAFLLIRPIGVFHRSPALPSQLSITRVYIFFEQTISMRNKKQDIHVKCSNGSFSQPRGICHVSILIYLFRYLQSANLVCVVSYGCVFHAIKQSCSYDTNNWYHGQNTYRFISEASSYDWTPRMRSLQQLPVCESQVSGIWDCEDEWPRICQQLSRKYQKMRQKQITFEGWHML